MSEIKESLDKVISELESQGITKDNYSTTEGLGDKVAAALEKFGITDNRVSEWFGIDGCGCQKRKQFLNSVLSFLKK